jgi:DNA-binding MarR family transcriptional regulator
MTPALAARPGFLVRRLHQIHLALFAEECSGFGITPVQYSIMTIAAVTPGLDQAQLAQEAGIDRATLANVAARLEKKFLIRRRPSASDKRVKLVFLSPGGATLLKKMRAPAQRAHDRTIAALPPQDRQKFLSLLIKLVDAQNDYGRAPLNLR